MTPRILVVPFIDAHNERPRPRKRTRSTDEILVSNREFWLRVTELGRSGKASCEFRIQDTMKTLWFLPNNRGSAL